MTPLYEKSNTKHINAIKLSNYRTTFFRNHYFTTNLVVKLLFKSTFIFFCYFLLVDACYLFY